MHIKSIVIIDLDPTIDQDPDCGDQWPYQGDCLCFLVVSSSLAPESSLYESATQSKAPDFIITIGCLDMARAMQESN